MHYGWDTMGWMMPFGGFIWFIVLVLIAVAIVWLFREPGRIESPPHGTERRSPGLAILEERYARGEINREEYLQKKRDILGQHD